MNIFSNNLKRTEILDAKDKINPSILKQIKINIHRNHAFEPIESIIAPFLAFSKIWARFLIGSYDDSLGFDNFQKSDLEIIWLDLSRYKNNPTEHINKQLKYLKNLTTAPILIIFMDLEIKHLVELSESNLEVIKLSDFLTSNDLDDSKSSITGTRLSNKACIKIAQMLGLKHIPSLLLPTLKAIVLDLDNTLYQGIIGEDGIENIKLTQEHIKLQEKILEYKKQGFLLAIASKNEEEDAKKLFETRKDFILKWDDFDIKKINWDPKAENIKSIAKIFNIGLDSILFIDDNIAEIESVKILDIKTILATSPKEVLEILNLFPQMQKNNILKEDLIRSQDIQANQIRKSIENLSQEEYFKNLKITLDFSIDNKEHIQRITELLNKTNQFISNYTRPSPEQVNQWFIDKTIAIVTISMSDKLSDSGIIAIFIGKQHKEKIEIIDLCISCRALGRKLEEIMFFYAIKLISKKLSLPYDEFVVFFQNGERNGPFLDFLSKISHQKNINPPFITIKPKEIKLEGLCIKENT